VSQFDRLFDVSLMSALFSGGQSNRVYRRWGASQNRSISLECPVLSLERAPVVTGP